MTAATTAPVLETRRVTRDYVSGGLLMAANHLLRDACAANALSIIRNQLTSVRPQTLSC